MIKTASNVINKKIIYLFDVCKCHFIFEMLCVSFELLLSITDLLLGLAEFIFVLQVIICKHQSLSHCSQCQNTDICLQLALFFIIFDRKHVTTRNSYYVSRGFQGLFAGLAVIDSSNIFVNNWTHLVYFCQINYIGNSCINTLQYIAKLHVTLNTGLVIKPRIVSLLSI